MSRYHHTRLQASVPLDPAELQEQMTDEVKSVDQLAKKYGFAQPDEVAGPASGAAYLDYGRPVTISDSARTARTQTQDEMWANALHQRIDSRP
jgi:hypothetical protein